MQAPFAPAHSVPTSAPAPLVPMVFVFAPEGQDMEEQGEPKVLSPGLQEWLSSQVNLAKERFKLKVILPLLY